MNAWRRRGHDGGDGFTGWKLVREGGASRTGVAVRYGVHIFITAESITATEACRTAEELGLDSFWLPEHTHIPAGRATDYPLGGDLPEEYRRCFDPLVGLSLAASVTTRIRLGTGIMLAAQHDPITTAKAIASLDAASPAARCLAPGSDGTRTR
jgi:alkanesulfonate monooxygenase SsuD/methylene tetrahydromethanopterin reductase-like flavin-dependent oxidoreductase (luciferase family)